MIIYNSFNITKSISIGRRFKEKRFTQKPLVRKHTIRTISRSWLDYTNVPAAGCDMFCYNYDNLRILRARYNCNQPATNLSDYDEGWFYEDIIKEKFRDDAFKFRKN